MKIDVFWGVVLLLSLGFISCGGEKTNTNKSERIEKKIHSEVKKQEKETYNLTIDISKTKADFENGKKMYHKYCMSCHFAGISGAQALQEGKYKIEDWKKSAEKGMEILLMHSVNGYNKLMPPMGTCMNCSEKDMFDAISYMFKEAKVEIATIKH